VKTINIQDGFVVFIQSKVEAIA